jgi:hypothetical protein
LAIQDPYPAKLYQEIGEWLKENTERSDTVGHIEIGLIGFYSQRRMIDPSGLVTPSAIEYVRNRDLSWAYRVYLPKYLVVNHHFSALLGPYQQEPWFQNCYDHVHSVEDIRIFERCDALNRDDLVMREDSQVLNNMAVGEILPERTIGQTFIAQEDNLRAVNVLLSTYERDLNGPLIFHLQEVTEEFRSMDLATVEMDLSEVDNNVWRIFSFPPIQDSSGRRYYFYFESPQAESGEAITAWATAEDSYSSGNLYINHQPQAGDLSFNLYYVRP